MASLLGLTLPLVWAAYSFADARPESSSESKGGYTVEWYTNSRHSNEHWQECEGRDDIIVQVSGSPAGDPQYQVQGLGYAHRTACIAGTLKTPLGGTIYAIARSKTVSGQRYNRNFASAFAEWVEGPIAGAMGELRVDMLYGLAPWDNPVVQMQVISAHCIEVYSPVIQTSAIPTITLPEDAPMITCTLYQDGEPSYVLNQSGVYVVELDENDDVV